MNNKKILYVIDMVNGFVKEGIMHDDYIANSINEQISLIKKFKKENQPIAFIKESHDKNCAEFDTFPEHCVKGTSEAELVKELKEHEEDALVYLKNCTSAIFAPNLIKDLDKMKNLEEIIICGCCTDICVLNFAIPLKNYLNQINRKAKIIVVEKATETYDAPNHNRDEYNEIAYKLIKQSGIEVVKNTRELEQLEQKRKGMR